MEGRNPQLCVSYICMCRRYRRPILVGTLIVMWNSECTEQFCFTFSRFWNRRAISAILLRFEIAERLLRRMSETPTSTTSQKSIAIHLQFVLQDASNLYCSAFGAAELPGKGNTSVRLPFVLQYASRLYRSTPPICIAIHLPFVSQYFWENLGGCGHRDVPQLRCCNLGI